MRRGAVALVIAAALLFGTRVIAWTRVVWPMVLVGMTLIVAIGAAVRLRVRLATRHND